VHSLRPNTMRGHVVLYRAALHDDANTIPTWFQETISSYVSILNDCPYSLANHWANARHLIGDEARADAIEAALHAKTPESVFDGPELAMLQYTEKLTLTPTAMVKEDVDALKVTGIDDGEILEANQIIGYFNYVNRCLNGLGVTTDGDIVGYYSQSD
ncbi:MAG: carboxymuconolactone decarboxylase family protein, partial [Leucothrix sp.]